MEESRKKKTILIFSAFYDPFMGGAERYVQEITQRLSDDYRFVILTSRLSPETSPYEKRGEVEIYRLGVGLGLDKYLFPGLAVLKAFSIKHDLVHAVMESYAGLALLVYSFFNKKNPTLLTVQSGRVKMPKFLFKLIHRAPDKIQAISQALAERARKLGADDVVVIPNGVELEDFKKFKETQREKYRIVCVAFLKEVKGIKYLVRALPLILRKFPEARLVLVGDGPERGNLENQVRKLGLEDKIEFKGALPHDRIPEELAKSHVFVLPSLAEGMGISVLEAQAAGVPVVASGVDGILDLIQDGKNGLLVKPKDPEGIAQAVCKIFSDSDLAQSIISKAEQNIPQYSWKNITHKIKRIYSRLL